MIANSLMLEVALLVAISVGVSSWQRDSGETGRLAFSAICGAIAIAVFGDLLGVRALTSEVAADRVKYLGMMLIPPLWLGFSAHIARLDIAQRMPWFPALFLVPTAALYSFMFSDRFGVLFMTTIEGGTDLYGPLWWISFVYLHALNVTGMVILVISASRSSVSSHRIRQGGVALAALAPMLVSIAVVRGIIDLQIDPTLLLLAGSLLIIRSCVDATGMLDPMPIPPRELLHQLPLGVILADGRDCVVEMSDVASNRLGVFEEFSLGQPLPELLAQGPDGIKIESVDIRQRNQPAGRLVLLR